MKHILLLTALIIPSFTHAQYTGGINDGVSLALQFNGNPLPGIYFGGINDGQAQIEITSQNALPTIYLGGIDDGVAAIAISNQNALPSIYLGGLNDGVASINVPTQNALPSIYLGGLNDGVASLAAPSQNMIPSIYLGGINDGVAGVTVFDNNQLPSIYRGGINDGTSSITVTNVNSATIPLPITILVFSGNWFNDDAILEWKTGIETGLDHFELERSSDGGSRFEYIATIGPNTQPDQHDYRYTDVRAWYLPQDYLLYRLKAIDKDGKHKYSGVVKLSKDKTQPVIVVYPNPTSGRFTLALMNVKDLNGYSYMLTGTDGKLIRRGAITEANTSFDLSGYASATYHLLLIKDGHPNQHFTILLTQ